MKCPKCLNIETKVVDSRPVEEAGAIRRRRECEKCNFRFSTYEQLEILDLAVMKRDGTRQPYLRDKLERGLKRAFEKRNLTDYMFRKVISEIEQDIQKKSGGGEITSELIGEIIMKVIRKVDKVAYIRFASVYRQFEDIHEFKQEILKL
ncbi:MAG TPA: transcriptional regulator NrdR [Candidatus Doudnabacteria bacterium]|nr:transcriptional regulator NrdR [Candidatus Doudnabacteria bacterium]